MQAINIKTIKVLQGHLTAFEKRVIKTMFKQGLSMGECKESKLLHYT